MIDLSRAKVNMRVPKNRFKLSDVDTITWLYKISIDTTDFRRVDDILEIQLFAVSFKGGKINKHDLFEIQKNVQYPIIFIIQSKSYFIIENYLLESCRQFVDGDTLMLEQRSAKLIDLYDDIVAEFIPLKRRDDESIADFVSRYKNMIKLELEITIFQRKVDSEKQPNKRIELNELLKALKSEKEQNNE